MTTKGIADVIFCLDASASMRPCIEAVRRHVADFVSGLTAGAAGPKGPRAAGGQAGPAVRWDLRVDFVAHCAGEEQGDAIFHQRSLFNPNLLNALYSAGQGPAPQGRPAARFFTSDLEEFRRGLAAVRVFGDEAPLVALDSCLDFPWRESSACHRVVIVMTDEPFETGVCADLQRQALPALLRKIQQRRVMLFIVGPQSKVFDDLSAVDRSEYEIVDAAGDGLAKVDFRQVLAHIGKSVSASAPQTRPAQQAAPPDASRGLFGQRTWAATSREIRGA